jgi:hypothetical protein
MVHSCRSCQPPPSNAVRMNCDSSRRDRRGLISLVKGSRLVVSHQWSSIQSARPVGVPSSLLSTRYFNSNARKYMPTQEKISSHTFCRYQGGWTSLVRPGQAATLVNSSPLRAPSRAPPAVGRGATAGQSDESARVVKPRCCMANGLHYYADGKWRPKTRPAKEQAR